MTFFKTTLLAAALSVATLSAAFAHEYKVGDMEINHPWSRETPATAEVAPGFLKMTNHGQQADRLLKATAEISDMVQIHEMVMTGDTMKMQELPNGIEIPAGATVELKPKSLHIMFMKIKQHRKQGESFKGTLTFEKAGTVEVVYHVEAPGAGH